MTLKRILQCLVVGCTILSCDEEKTGAANSAVDEVLDLPKPPYMYFSGTFSDEQIQLGRVLFYDPKLSSNNSVSCGSCHKQEYAFGDNVAFSKGFKGELTLRNTLPLVDARQSASVKSTVSSGSRPGGLFWDGRKGEMQEAVMEPIFNHIEMGMDWASLLTKLKDVPYYPPLFTTAFGRGEVTYPGVQSALSAFVSAMRSDASKFERSLAGQTLLTADEQKGSILFVEKYRCNACHQGHMGKFASSEYQQFAEFANIGLEETYKDKGLGLLTNLQSDEGRFRVPNLSNVALTAPYMHDGSIASLDQVIDHYRVGIVAHPNVDSRLIDPYFKPIKLQITREEKGQLIAFLHALTDKDVTTNQKLANPFKNKEN